MDRRMLYPLLHRLQRLGYVTTEWRTPPEGRRRRYYAITDEGRAYLAEHSETVDGIFERMARFVEGFLDEPMMEVNGAFRKVGRATYGTASRHVRDAERLRKVREILERAAREIEELGR